jgi:DNA ligase (NAD+)
MTVLTPQKEWLELAEKIRFYDEAYYQKGVSLISDEAYDALRARLLSLEKQHPFLKTSSSPSETIGAPPTEKVSPHLSPVYSLDNIFDQQQLAAFLEKVSRFLALEGPMTWVGEPKIDGLTIVLRYQDGQLVRGATRGDGTSGEDITPNVMTLASLPLSVPKEALPPLIELRGEVFISKDQFALLNQQRQKEGLPAFANPRNAAAGSLRQLEASVTASRCLSYILHGFSHPLGPTYTESMRRLKELGFETQPLATVCSTEEEMALYVQKISEIRDTLGYEVDGTVFKLDRIEWQERLGHSARAPRFAMAYKFAAPQGVTRIEAIEIQVGRTGSLTPVAHLSPVEVGGVTITRASLHNADEIARKDIRIGDTVLIERAGDVIPQVCEVLHQYRPQGTLPYRFPQSCPVCGGPVVREEGYAVQKCVSLHCKAKAIWRLRHCVSRKAFDIEGLGPRHLTFLYEKGWVLHPEDLFLLKRYREELKALEGWGEKSVETLLATIESKRTLSLDRFLYALGIPQIGETTARTLASYYETLEGFQNALFLCQQSDTENLAVLSSINSIGPSIVEEMLLFFQQYDISKLLSHLTVLPFSRPSAPTDSPLFGKTVVFTGTLQHMTRSEAKQWAETLGAKVTHTLSSHTDYVIVGQEAGSKKAKALALGVTLLEEKEWLSFLPQSIFSEKI